MEVKVKTGLLEMQTFTANIESGVLSFQSQRNNIRIPLAELTRLYIAGASEDANSFIIEAGGRKYEGRFLNTADGESLLEQLRERIGHQPEIKRKQNEEK